MCCPWGFGKMTGYLYNKWLAGLHFWFFFIGVNIIFFPQHFIQMKRRYVEYPVEMESLNALSTFGIIPTGIGMLFFFFMLIEAFVMRRPAGDNYWGEGATTLEWTLSSPPPFHQFNKLPVIADDDHH